MTDIDFVRPPCKVLLVCRSSFHTLRSPGCNCRCNRSLCRCNSGRQSTRMRDPLKRPSKRSSWLLSLLQGSIKKNQSRSARSYPGDVRGRHHVRCRAVRFTDGPRRAHRRTHAESTVRMEFYRWTSTHSSDRFRASQSTGRLWPFSKVRGRPLDGSEGQQWVACRRSRLYGIPGVHACSVRQRTARSGHTIQSHTLPTIGDREFPPLQRVAIHAET
jgi:hypothetical protein